MHNIKGSDVYLRDVMQRYVNYAVNIGLEWIYIHVVLKIRDNRYHHLLFAYEFPVI